MVVIANSELIGKQWNDVTDKVVKPLDPETGVKDLNGKVVEMLGTCGNMTVEMFRIKKGTGEIEAVSKYDLEDGKVSVVENVSFQVKGSDESPEDRFDNTFQYDTILGMGEQSHPTGEKSLVLFQDILGQKSIFRFTKR